MAGVRGLDLRLCPLRQGEAVILIDPRSGSKELFPFFLQSRTPCELSPLEFADVAFVGNGPTGAVPIGIERKTIGDLAQSLMNDRLVGHQLPGLVEMYPYRWIVVEGIWRIEKDATHGVIEVPRGKTWVPLTPRIRGDQLTGWLLTLELRGGVHIHYTSNIYETTDWLTHLYSWWTKKEWTDHKSHLAVFASPDTALFRKAKLVERMARQLDGIGDEKAQTVANTFATPLDMCAAGESQWQAIPGIGKVLASRTVRALQTK